MTYDSITVIQSSPHVGAEIGNVDLTKPLSNREVEEIRDAINAHGVVFFRDQDVSVDDHIAFGQFVRPRGKHIHLLAKSRVIGAVCKDNNRTRQPNKIVDIQ